VRLRRAAGWLLVLALLELSARAVVYGLEPSRAARLAHLNGSLGGPRFVAVLLAALCIGLAGAASLVWLASLGVRERWALADDRPAGAAPRLPLRPLLLRAVALTLGGWLTFAGVESLIHLQAGLGFHGLTCLVGPLHRNALPVIACFALLGSAAVAAVAHVLAWMRRTVGTLARPRATARRLAAVVLAAPAAPMLRPPLFAATAPRGPPPVVA
jgi:hypothetical protein